MIPTVLSRAALCCGAWLGVLSSTRAQLPYIAPVDTAVQHKLAAWRDLKFGLLMHWGPYSQWGVVESWSICPEDEDWCRRDSTHGRTYSEYLRNYEALQRTFDPVRFDPAHWAAAAEQAGMRYVVFTTKHHDGFCMFDTRTTDYRITASACPFHDDPRANVARGVFDAFRARGLWTGAYFSKPDWHDPDYWWSYFPPKDRHVNYDPLKYPQRWQSYRDRTYAQIEELMTGYGPMDILWLDGGWVKPPESMDTTVVPRVPPKYAEDVDIPRIAAMARSHQPGLLVVDRTVGGAYENYVTPEAHVPEKDLGVPWETCMPLANSWSYVPNDTYKRTDEVVRMLVRVVSRGGSLLLNVGPGPDGEWDPIAYTRLNEVGAWMTVNGEGIYGTVPAPPVPGSEGTTQSKDGRVRYAFVPDSVRSLTLDAAWMNDRDRITVLGASGTCRYTLRDGKVVVTLPAAKPSSAGLRAVRFARR